MPVLPPMAETSRGTLICSSAQGVELLLEHHSMPVIEFVDRIALAVRNDFSVSRRAPPSNVAFWAGLGRTGGRTLRTISVTIDPLFFSSLRGLDVAVSASVSLSTRRAP